ncbi:GFA family protein [Parerythrobacter jejuensis]|uniref:Aldehyde-activating protein n=1 Tax=Parerythrobacter jejuensis TaxID=795812 RepID=A0A845AN93_9SPHN|nr:GFA family protein [Parerythrobacter jejuensis]MXP30321.1 aldehyde-activating protein [Parerythrobacter jejuensis]MXP33081.1 aldehyde-activating protein [Parerythrobacter jejuensis]
MTRPITGGCLCGSIRYAIAGDPPMQVTCHCKNCQRQAGTAFSCVVGMPPEMLEIDGEVKVYKDHGESGSAVYREFCGKCGSPVFTRADSASGMIFVKAGTFDDAERFSPTMHLFTKSQQHWLDTGSVPSFATMPAEGSD